MIIGARKCGTVTLHRFWSQHFGTGTSWRKEVRLFDAREYSRDWTSEHIDERYRPLFEHYAVSWFLRLSYLPERARMRALSR